ncbi:hypothetical protein LPJ77_003830 [Coemansia sp. RSA 2523]|nr:hypothetical protein LPJ77_003830 [Coemansia sp. RSA 2523]KAJ2163903.1 hypothetical protein GGH15_004216 [Coemansia sp. RSA 562]
MRHRRQCTVLVGSVLAVLYGVQPGAATPMRTIAQVDPGSHATSSSHAVQTGTSDARIGGVIVPSIALRTTGTLSDTKIFVLLAAIVFVFLLALGVAMTRVSRGRRQQHAMRIEQHIGSSVPPPTLNKTILDVLPVFEVTSKRQLRQLHASEPQTLGKCFGDSCSTYSLPPNVCEGSTSHTPHKIAAPMSGYRLDSGKASVCSDAHGTRSYESNTSVLTGNLDAVELGACHGIKRPMSPPAVFRRHGSSATPESSYNDYTDLDTRPALDRAYANINVSATPDRTFADMGGVMFRARSTRSLDLTPDYETAMAQSQPEIGRRVSVDADAGLGACPICLEEFEAGEHLRELPCLHRYHLVCIDTWLVSRSTCCPYCKLDIRRWFHGAEHDGLDAIPRVGPAPLIDQIPDHAPRTLIRGVRPTNGRLARVLRAVHNVLN